MLHIFQASKVHKALLTPCQKQLLLSISGIVRCFLPQSVFVGYPLLSPVPAATQAIFPLICRFLHLCSPSRQPCAMVCFYLLCHTCSVEKAICCGMWAALQKWEVCFPQSPERNDWPDTCLYQDQTCLYQSDGAGTGKNLMGGLYAVFGDTETWKEAPLTVNDLVVLDCEYCRYEPATKLLSPGDEMCFHDSERMDD